MKTNRLLLGVLCLSGCLIFSKCLLHDYHFVNINSTWNDAQTYCRTIYTDLATIVNITEMNQVITISSGSNSQVWIGVYVDIGRDWTYDIKVKFVDWQDQTQNDPVIPYCFGYSFLPNAGWQYDDCYLEHPFVCFNGTQGVYVNQSMNWFRAWSYCKQNFIDLDCNGYGDWNYTSWLYNAWTYNQNMNNLLPLNVRVWTGYVQYPHMYWSDGSSFSFTYWSNITYTYDFVSLPLGGAVDLQRSGKWSLQPYNTTLPFVCYGGPKESVTVFKLRLSSSVDLNNPDMNENILKQLQDKLEEKGLSGVTLSWRKQPDGKIFYREEKPTEADGCGVNV